MLGSIEPEARAARARRAATRGSTYRITVTDSRTKIYLATFSCS